jgi:hypothetical protein
VLNRHHEGPCFFQPFDGVVAVHARHNRRPVDWRPFTTNAHKHRGSRARALPVLVVHKKGLVYDNVWMCQIQPFTATQHRMELDEMGRMGRMGHRSGPGKSAKVAWCERKCVSVCVCVCVCGWVWVWVWVCE